jgi:hypothetical protein
VYYSPGIAKLGPYIASPKWFFSYILVIVIMDRTGYAADRIPGLSDPAAAAAIKRQLRVRDSHQKLEAPIPKAQSCNT